MAFTFDVEGRILPDRYPMTLICGAHVHPCPECYEDGICTAACNYEPDLQEPGGPLTGSYATCDDCRAQKRGKESP